MSTVNLWMEARDRLKMTMKQEVGLMREILANMHQEELNLLMGDKTGWTTVVKERSELMQRLEDLKKTRMDTMQTLQGLLPASKKENAKPLDRLLALDDESYSEILLLQDQFSALIERINFQNVRNQTLFHQVEQRLSLNSSHAYNPITMPSLQKPKKKISIATCERPEQ